MLFKTVYGPELQTIAEYIATKPSVTKEKIIHTFVPSINGNLGNTTNLEDALAFLTSAHIIDKNANGTYENQCMNTPFHARLLACLRQIQQDSSLRVHPADGWYYEIIDRLFVQPDEVLQFGLHKKINALISTEQFSEERINAWKRVLEFAGVGRRIYSGFLCNYHPKRIQEIITLWTETEGPLQLFLEKHFDTFLPWKTKNAEMSRALSIPLEYLHTQGILTLSLKQDLPHRSYIKHNRSNWIMKGAR